ncbi:MAG: T6SS immunity protein Tdi1 domain-containing protein [Candidatus Promineifilaceae bacterium]
MDWYKRFLKANGPAIKCRPVSDRDIQKYEDTLPASYLTFWQKNGSCGYAKGLIWVIHPSDLLGEMREFLGKEYKKAIPFARTVFGDIFFWEDTIVHHLDVQNGNILSGMHSIDAFWGGMLVDKEYLNDVLKQKVFRLALLKLGEPNYDECYAFVPALALGGSDNPETLQRIKLKEYLGILANLR